MRFVIMKYLVICIVCTLSPLLAMGQSADRPEWVNGYFKEMSNSYVEVVSATGHNVQQARNMAVQEAVRRRSLATGEEANVATFGNEINVVSNHNLIVKSRILDEYVAQVSDGYVVYLLVQTAKNPSFQYEQVRVTNEYGFSPCAFVPGLMQIKKGSVGKGAFFIGAEIAFVGGIVVAECMRSSNVSKMNSTHSVANKKSYADNADMCANVRNVAIAGAAAIYLWNVIDGIAAKGKKHIDISENKSLDIMPYVAMDGGGLALSFSF